MSDQVLRKAIGQIVSSNCSRTVDVGRYYIVLHTTKILICKKKARVPEYIFSTSAINTSRAEFHYFKSILVQKEILDRFYNLIEAEILISI